MSRSRRTRRQITDPKDQKLIENFNTISEQDGLAFYPDWPVARLLRRAGLRLPGADQRSKSPDQVLDAIAKPYDEGVKEITGK